MKRTLLFSFILLCAFGAQATVRRVNNIVGVNAQYNSISAAVTAAAAGDTLYVEPSPTSYGNLNLTKKLTVIGNGYFNDPVSGYIDTRNSGLQANMTSTVFASVTFSNGSEFSTIMGCMINDIGVYENNITIKRNMIISGISISNYNTSTGLYVNRTNLDIRQNIISLNGIFAVSFDNSKTFSNINIQNNIIRQVYNSSYGIVLPNGASGFIQNNILDANSIGLNVYSFQINNNIMTYSGSSGFFTANNNVWFNNAASGTAFGTANGNQANISNANMFNNFSLATEERYVLKSPGPGIGTGFGGVDIGVFGGPDPYKLSGIPPIPTIYLFTAPATTTSTTLPVTISTRSNN